MKSDTPLDPPGDGAPPPMARPGSRMAATGAMVIAILLHVVILVVLGLVIVFRSPEPEISIIAVNVPAPVQIPDEKRVIEDPKKRKPNPSSAAAIPTITTTAVSAVAIPVPLEESITGNPLGSMGDGLGAGLRGMFGGGDGVGPAFFGIKTDAARIVFVVDVSLSMSSGKGLKNAYFRVEDELVKALAALKPTTHVNVIVFGGDTKSYRRRLVAADADSIEDITEWVKRRGPVRRVERDGTIEVEVADDGIHRGTRTDLGLTEAFRDDPEMIVFLSDGRPTGKSEDEIHAMVAEFQEKRDKTAVINTIAYRSNAGKEFMQKLSADSKGTFKEVK